MIRFYPQARIPAVATASSSINDICNETLISSILLLLLLLTSPNQSPSDNDRMLTTLSLDELRIRLFTCAVPATRKRRSNDEEEQ